MSNPGNTNSAAFAPLAERPRVSVVVRTHGPRSGFLQEAVASIIAQDYRPLEIIVVEDGSNHAAEWIAEQQQMLANSPDVTLRHLPVEKGGRCRGGNAGLAAATGELCGFLDDDDLFLGGHIDQLVRCLRANASCGAAYAAALEVPTRIESLSPLSYQELGRFPASAHEFDAELLRQKNITPIQCVLFRRELFSRFGGLDDRLDALEDWDLWRRYAQAAPFAFVNKITSIYRVPGDPESARRRQLIFCDYQRIVERLWRVDPGRTQLNAPHVSRETSEPSPKAISTNEVPATPSRSRRMRAAARDYLLRHPKLYACWWHARMRLKRDHSNADK